MLTRADSVLVDYTTLVSGIVVRAGRGQTGDYPFASLLSPKAMQRGESIDDLPQKGMPFVSFSEKHVLQQGDILLQLKGDPKAWRSDFWVDEKKEVVPTNSLLIVRALEGVDPGFLLWYLRRPQTRDWLRGRMGGSTVPSLKVSDIRSMPFEVPPYAVQVRIGQRYLLHLREKDLMQLQINLIGELTLAETEQWFTDAKNEKVK